MLILLHGKDTYRLRQKLREIEQRYAKLHQGGLNLEKYDVSKATFQDFWDNFFQQSMFVKKKLFFLENTLSNENFKEQFLKKIKEISESKHNIAVCIEKKEVPRTERFFRNFIRYGMQQEFALLTGQLLKNWVKKEFEKQAATVEEFALKKLIYFVGNDLWQMSREIQKLSAYSKNIKAEDVELLVKPKIETEIFKTIDALAARDRKKALSLTHYHLEKGDSPFYILTMINFQFRNLLLVKDFLSENRFAVYQATGSALAQTLKMHPFVLRKTMTQVGKFSLPELKKIYRKIFEADLNMKTGFLSAEDGLKMLIANI